MCICDTETYVIGFAEGSPFTPVTAAASDSIQSAHMYYESLWSKALNHSSIYSINSFLLWHMIIGLPLQPEQFLPTPLPLTELPAAYWEVSFGCATPSEDLAPVSEVIKINIFSLREKKNWLTGEFPVEIKHTSINIWANAVLLLLDAK